MIEVVINGFTSVVITIVIIIITDVITIIRLAIFIIARPFVIIDFFFPLTFKHSMLDQL